MDCTAPNGVRCVVLTVPLPLQSGHISGVVPGAQPVPLQSGALLDTRYGDFLFAAEGRFLKAHGHSGLYALAGVSARSDCCGCCRRRSRSR